MDLDQPVRSRTPGLIHGVAAPLRLDPRSQPVANSDSKTLRLFSNFRSPPGVFAPSGSLRSVRFQPEKLTIAGRPIRSHSPPRAGIISNSARRIIAPASLLPAWLASRRPSGLRKTIADGNSLAHRTTWLRSDLLGPIPTGETYHCGSPDSLSLPAACWNHF